MHLSRPDSLSTSTKNGRLSAATLTRHALPFSAVMWTFKSPPFLVKTVRLGTNPGLDLDGVRIRQRPIKGFYRLLSFADLLASINGTSNVNKITKFRPYRMRRSIVLPYCLLISYLYDPSLFSCFSLALQALARFSKS